MSINQPGKRIVQLQASLALVQDAGSFAKKSPEDPFGRVPFTHQALDGLNNLSSNTKKFLTSKTKLSELAQKYEAQKVIRWSPRKVRSLTLRVPSLTIAILIYTPSPTTSRAPVSTLSWPTQCMLWSVLLHSRREDSLRTKWRRNGYWLPWD